VDDCIIVNNNLKLTCKSKENLKKEFEIISENDFHYILGIQVIWNHVGGFIIICTKRDIIDLCG
jgi:hypothetical protein